MPDRQRPAPAVTACDPLRLLFRRATALCDQGFAQKAVHLLDNAWSGIAAGDPRHEAQLELADALIALGDVARASKVLASVRRHSAECVSERAEWFADRELLTEARLAFAIGRDAEVGPALSAMIERQGVAQRAGELAFDALVECGMWHCANARFDDARRLLRRARTVAAKTAELSPPQRISLALLEAYCVEDGADVFDGSYRRFRVALDASVAAGSMRGALEATTGLMGYYASVGSDGPMYDLAERALDIARATEGRRQMLVAAAWIGTTFMKTAQWRAVSRLLFEAEELSPKGALYWTFVKEAQGDFLARTGRYEAAQSCFAAAQDAARNLKNRKWEAIALRDAGTMLGRIGHAAESAESMRRAVEIAEGAAGAWSASLTYRAAAKVLADRRVERLANSMPATLVEPGRRATRDAAGRGARHGALVLSREPSTT
jgi:tetratricopeptide (TPR) repeat protein